MEWRTVDTVLSANGESITSKGLVQWLNRMYARYLCRTYYYGQTETVVQAYRRDLMKSMECNPKPLLLDLMGNEDDGFNQILNLGTLNRLKYEANGLLHTALKEKTATLAPKLSPPLVALAFLCLGFHERPPRPRKSI